MHIPGHALSLLPPSSRLRLSASLFFTIIILPTAIPSASSAPPATHIIRDRYGAIIRGDVTAKKLALVFTGDKRGESTTPILDTLKQRQLKAALFVTGNFVRDAKLLPLLKRAIAEGHYVGPHSDAHLLYAPWNNRDDDTWITKDEFQTDLKKNIAELKKIGALKGEKQILFIPPFEWFNRQQVQWSTELDVTLINFTPGSGSNRDYAVENDPWNFESSQKIYDDILAYEQKDPHGLNGFVLLLHLGSGRKDPFHPKLGPLCDVLTKRGYKFVRVDELLRARGEEE